MEDENQFVKIAILESPIEAQLIAPVLEEENILHRIVSYHDTAYDGLFQFQKGWGEVKAPLRFKEEILEILSEIRSEQDDYQQNTEEEVDDDEF